MFSRRTAWDLTPNAFSIALQRARSSPLLIDLTESNPTRVGLHYPATQVLAALSNPCAVTYEPNAFGLASARHAISLAYNDRHVQVDPSNILLTASSSESYAWLLKLLCDPGDSILVPRPSYPLFDDLARIESVELRQYELFYDGRWHIDVEGMHRAIDDRTRAIFVVSPNNPTGSYLRRSERVAIESIARAHALAIVSDEVFEDYVWVEDAERVACLAAESTVLSFSLGGLSKSACLPQMKLGWIVVGGPLDATQTAMGRLEMVADTFLSVGTPVQHAASKILALRADIQGQLKGRILANLCAVRRAIGAQSSITMLAVEAGWYAVLRVPSVMTDEQWAVRMLELDKVIVHPGSFFGFHAEGYLVISLIADESTFARGVHRLVASVDSACF